MSEEAGNYSNRKGVMPISWEDFHRICKAIAAGAAAFQPEIILGIARGGYYPAALAAHMLQVEIYMVRVTRRLDDRIVRKVPIWIVEPPAVVAGRRVLIVDEICGSGETITMVKDRVASLGAAQVKSAVLYAHSRGVSTPDYIGLVSDALLLNPWDREIFREGAFQVHPEYREALALQGIQADASMLIQTRMIHLAKS